MPMMPGVGFFEMVLLVVVGIVVIGPKELPLMMRKFGRFTGKMRSLAFEFKQGFDELGRQAELEELRKEVQELKKHTGIDELNKELEQDRINMEKDIASAIAPLDEAAMEESRLLSESANADPNSGVNTIAQPEDAVAGANPALEAPASTHVADAGDDFHIDGPAPPAKPKQDAPA